MLESNNNTLLTEPTLQIDIHDKKMITLKSEKNRKKQN